MMNEQNPSTVTDGDTEQQPAAAERTEGDQCGGTAVPPTASAGALRRRRAAVPFKIGTLDAIHRQLNFTASLPMARLAEDLHRHMPQLRVDGLLRSMELPRLPMPEFPTVIETNVKLTRTITDSIVTVGSSTAFTSGVLGGPAAAAAAGLGIPALSTMVSTTVFSTPSVRFDGLLRTTDLPRAPIPPFGPVAQANAKLFDAILGPNTAAMFATTRATANLFAGNAVSGLVPQVIRGSSAGVRTLLDNVLPQLDLGAFGKVFQVGEMFAGASVAPVLTAVSLPSFTRMVGEVVDGLCAMVVDLLGRWSGLAATGHFLAGLGRQAALRTRAVILAAKRRADVATVRAAVAEFAQFWLGLKRITAKVIDVVMIALLDPRWEQVEPDRAIETIQLIRRQEARGDDELIGAKGRGDLRVRSLDIADGEFPVAVHPLWTSYPTRETTRSEELDPRIARVLDRLSDEEREIAATWAFGRAISWAQAAAECGQPPSRGESVRRKLDRLGTQFLQRYAAI